MPVSGVKCKSDGYKSAGGNFGSLAVRPRKYIRIHSECCSRRDDLQAHVVVEGWGGDWGVTPLVLDSAYACHHLDCTVCVLEGQRVCV